jgi:hypothetical protein
MGKEGFLIRDETRTMKNEWKVFSCVPNIPYSFLAVSSSGGLKIFS